MNPAMSVYRVGNFFHRHGMARVGWVISWINRVLFSTWIPSSATIGEKTIFGYWGLGTVVHKDAVIGANCLIGHNVTIGRNFQDIRVPVIGNNVYVGPGAVLFGEITIGDDVVIGANSVVNKDIPAGAVAAGVPARILSKSSESLRPASDSHDD